MAGGVQPFSNNQANLNPEDAANLRWSWRAAAAGPGSPAGPCWPGRRQQWPQTHWASSQMTPAHHQGTLGSRGINLPVKVKKKTHKAPWGRFQLSSSSCSSKHLQSGGPMVLWSMAADSICSFNFQVLLKSWSLGPLRTAGQHGSRWRQQPAWRWRDSMLRALY